MSSAIVTRGSKLYSNLLPNDILGCVMWIDAADGSTVSQTSGTVSGVLDKSGNGNNLTGGSGFTYPNNTFNGSYPSFFNTSNNSFIGRNTTFTLAQPCTIFAVGESTAPSGTFPYIADSNVSTTRIALYYWNNSGTLRSRMFAGAEIEVIGTVSRFVNSYYANTTTSQIFINGTSGVSGTISTGSFSGIVLGSFNGAHTVAWIGHLCEFIIYNRVLPTFERQQIEGYLARKWGISTSLPTTHPYRTVLPYTRPFAPVDIDGCRMWIDAADATTVTLGGTGGTVSGVLDKSGNGFNLTSGNNFSYPNNTFNGTTLPSFYYDGNATNTRIGLNASLSVAQPVTHFLVAQKVSGTSTNGPYAFDGTTRNWFYHPSANNQITFGAGSSLGYNMPTNTFIACTVANGASSQIIFNGNIVVTGNAGTNGFAGIRLGGSSGTADPYNGHICEYICFNRVLTISERREIESYLAHKWGLLGNLPSTHPARLYRALTPAFDPRQVNGCVLWLDALDQSTVSPSTNGSTVTTWSDKSGNGYNATGYNNTSTYNTSGLAAGYPGLEFSSTKSMRSLVATGTFASAAVGFVVYKFTGSVNLSAAYGLVSRPVSSVNGIATPFDMFSYNGASYRNIGNGTNYTVSTAAPNYITNTSPTIYNFSIASTATTTWNESVNGTTATLTTSGGSGAAYGDTGTNNLLIGGRMDIAVYFQGVISEVIFYNTTLSAINRQRVEGYLAHKWGLQSSLPSTHPYKKIRP